MGVTQAVQKLQRCPKPQRDVWKLRRSQDLYHRETVNRPALKAPPRLVEPKQLVSPLGSEGKMVGPCCLNPLLCD